MKYYAEVAALANRPEGTTPTEVGETLGLSRQRGWQLLQKIGAKQREGEGLRYYGAGANPPRKTQGPGKLQIRILQALQDGEKTRVELAEQVTKQLTYALRLLEKNGYIVAESRDVPGRTRPVLFYRRTGKV